MDLYSVGHDKKQGVQGQKAYAFSVAEHKKPGFKRNGSSRPYVFCKKGVLKNFIKFTGKHLCQSLFFKKVAGRPATLLKNRLWHRCFSVNFVKFLRTSFFIDYSWWLLLKKV